MQTIKINIELPLISVLTPVYNGAQYLDELIQSIKNQDYPRVEHIIIDDGSTDGGKTKAVLEKYPHLKWWSRENKGQYATLNEAIDSANGDWICIISADDLLAGPHVFSELMNRAKQSSSFDAIFGRTSLINERSAEIAPCGRPDESAPIWMNYYFLVIHHCSLLVTRKFIMANNLYFDSLLKFTGDWDWIIRILKNGKVGYFDIVVSRYRIHEKQTRQVATQRLLEVEDKLVMSHYGSSMAIRKLIITYYRLKKLVIIIANDGCSAAFTALSQFFKKN
jgi:glycosyltransferase involved in cell wall biosynthesis